MTTLFDFLRSLPGLPRSRGRATAAWGRLEVENLEDRFVLSVLDLTTAGAAGTINGASFQQANPQPTGVGVINDFLRIQSHGSPVEQGYNSDVRPTQFDEKTDPNFTRTIHLSELPTVMIDNTPYKVILLGINQDHAHPLLSLDELRLYASDNPVLSGYDPGTKTLGGQTAVYDMGNNWVALNANLTHGNGSGDMYLYVPQNLLATSSGNPDPYVYLYSKFGVRFGANGGFEQWAPATAVSLPAPAQVSGFVYFDANNNGVFDPQGGDLGIGGVQVNLTGTNSLGQSVNLTTFTLADGSYVFTDLLPGTYSIIDTPPTTFQGQPLQPGTNDVGTVNGVTDGAPLGNDEITQIVLRAGQDGINYDFGEISPFIGS
jgi:hypothetical protein